MGQRPFGSIEPTGSSTGALSQSQAFAILFLTSDTAPRLKLPSFNFSIIAARRLYRQFSIVWQRLNESHGVWSKRGAAIYRCVPDFFGWGLVIDPQFYVNRSIAQIIVLQSKKQLRWFGPHTAG